MSLRLRIVALSAAALFAVPAAAVRGVTEGSVQVFKGLPYALPPVGAARWKPPVAMPMWNGVRDGTKFGPSCIQPKSRSGSIYAWDLGALSEDCLFLNVWSK